jgi:Fic-DOC domain mobile mystery protein B
MNDLFDADDAATPLTPDEKQGLIPTHVTLRSELNELEQRGVSAGEQWAFDRRRRKILDQPFLRNLHRHMFENVWRWAGEYRRTERNIGIDAKNIEVELKKLLDDADYWIEHKTYPPDEIALRLHHRLTWIHPFPNGNGRHARLAADLLITSLGGKRFSWGQTNLVSIGDARKRYIEALRSADMHNIESLLIFARF